MTGGLDVCMRVAAFFQTLQPEAHTVVGGSYSVRNNRRAGTKRLPICGLTGVWVMDVWADVAAVSRVARQWRSGLGNRRSS